ncbi:unnamed protein product [Spirodela intermedia]|uniref:Uncharacterized protein n=1 Tax=Spirodela intermedia TaxID=51605 RepID=A0A7I8IQM7_SPIIN|nr:unnamed protein product [Spirodela intermedia]CAA6660092.1 unnamed protein product [Spirodela intermedia]
MKKTEPSPENTQSNNRNIRSGAIPSTACVKNWENSHLVDYQKKKIKKLPEPCPEGMGLPEELAAWH